MMEAGSYTSIAGGCWPAGSIPCPLVPARPGVGAVTLALLFGLFALIYGVSQITMGIELRRTGKTLNSVKEEVTA
jgi:hypothetical protein